MQNGVKWIAPMLLFVISCASAQESPQKAALEAKLTQLQSLYANLIAAWDSGADPAIVMFPSGSSRKINRSVLKDARDAQYYADPIRNPPVGYIAVIEYRIGKLTEKINALP